MSNPTLINGFEDILTFIKQQEHRNQELKEENKKLKEENESLMKAEVRQEKIHMEEIKKLKEEHNKFDEIWKTEGITEQDIIDMKRQISNQCDLIKELKEEEEEESEEEEEEGDYVYGMSYDKEEDEYQLTMAGGGSHWWNYIIKKEGVYREDTKIYEKITSTLVINEDNYVRLIDDPEEINEDRCEGEVTYETCEMWINK